MGLKCPGVHLRSCVRNINSQCVHKYSIICVDRLLLLFTPWISVSLSASDPSCPQGAQRTIITQFIGMSRYNCSNFNQCQNPNSWSFILSSRYTTRPLHCLHSHFIPHRHPPLGFNSTIISHDKPLAMGWAEQAIIVNVTSRWYYYASSPSTHVPLFSLQ